MGVATVTARGVKTFLPVAKKTNLATGTPQRGMSRTGDLTSYPLHSGIQPKTVGDNSPLQEQLRNIAQKWVQQRNQVPSAASNQAVVNNTERRRLAGGNSPNALREQQEAVVPGSEPEAPKKESAFSKYGNLGMNAAMLAPMLMPTGGGNQQNQDQNSPNGKKGGHPPYDLTAQPWQPEIA